MTHPIPREPRPAAGAWRRLPILAALATFAVVPALTMPGLASAQGKRIAAPELNGGAGWVGTDRPLKLSDFRGKIVILDFWTSC